MKYVVEMRFAGESHWCPTVTTCRECNAAIDAIRADPQRYQRCLPCARTWRLRPWCEGESLHAVIEVGDDATFNTRSMDWRKDSDGSWLTKIYDGLFFFVRIAFDDRWKWRFEFWQNNEARDSEGTFDNAHDAMQAAQNEWDQWARDNGHEAQS